MTLATKITLVRIACIPAYMVFMYLSGGAFNTWMLVALALFILASLTDYVDGNIARKRNQVTDLGKFLDPLADKLLVLAAIPVILGMGNDVLGGFDELVQLFGGEIQNADQTSHNYFAPFTAR